MAEERARLAQTMMASLKSDRQIVDELRARYSISRGQAYQDIAAAKGLSVRREDRDRLQHAVVESIVARYGLAMARTRPVKCPSCQAEGMAVAANPDLHLATKICNDLVRVLKLELSPEQLLRDDELRERVFEQMVKSLPMFSAEQRQRLMDALARMEQPEGAQDSGPPAAI